MVTASTQANDVRITYDVHGALDGRTPLVCLHGNSEDVGFFADSIPALAERQPVIAIDSRAHGRSERGEGPLTIAGMAEDVVEVLDAEGVEAAQILGFSDGGNIAIALALAAPKRVRSLILCGANLNPGGVRARYQIPIVVQYGVYWLFAPFSKNFRLRSDRYGLMVNDPHFTADEIARINAPTLVMAGENDMIKDAHTRLIAETLPHATLHILPGGDHFILRDRRDACLAIIEPFLDEHR